MVVTAAWGKVGNLEDFFRLPAEQFFHIGEVAVVHHDDVVVCGKVGGFDFPAGECVRIYAHAVQNFRRAAVHVFAVVPAACACAPGMGADAVFGGGVVKDVFRHGRTADVAKADKQDFFHG